MEKNTPQAITPEKPNTHTELTQAEKTNSIEEIPTKNYADEVADLLGL
jgi:hypothetical protein